MQTIEDTVPINNYLDISIINNTSLEQSQELQFTETRFSSILDGDPSDFLFTVDRFYLTTTSLPFWIPDIEINQNDVNLTQYFITMEYDDAFVQQQFTFIPQNLNENLPNTPVTEQDIRTSLYYEVNSLDWVALNINTNLKSVFDALVVAKPAIPGGTVAPYIRINSDGSADFLAQNIYNEETAEASRIKVYFNTILYQMFSIFNFRNYGVNVTSPSTKCDKQAIWIPGLLKETINSVVFNVMQSTGSVIILWNPVQTIEFMTNLPVIYTPKSIEKPFGAITNPKSSSGSNNFSNILTNFIANENIYRPGILYEPSGVYRWFDINSQTPIKSINISVMWSDKYNNLHPFLLNAKGYGNIKLLFRKKTKYITS